MTKEEKFNEEEILDGEILNEIPKTAPAQERALLTNLMSLPASIYDIPFESAARLNAPVFYLGPRCRAIHQWCERVYLPDLVEIVPHIIDHILGLR